MTPRRFLALLTTVAFLTVSLCPPAVSAVLLPGDGGRVKSLTVAQLLSGLTPLRVARASGAGFPTLSPTDLVAAGESVFVQVSGDQTWPLPRDPGSTTRFVYDGDGGRVKQITSAGTTIFLGSSYELAPTGTTTKYVFAGSQRIAAKDSTGALRFYHTDHLGSSNVITNATGALVELNEHTPYGSLSRHEGTTDVPQKFTGQRLDASTGLYFYNARYYDPQLGRFIQADTIVPAPGDPQTLNRYSYARNNPVRYTDPTGHWSWSKFWKSFAGAFLGAMVTVLTGGLGAPLWLAGMLGGMSGGALSGGLSGGWKGALYGGGIGGALGAFGGWGVGKFGAGFGVGMLAAGAGVAGATNNLDSFAGGLTGGFLGAGVGNGIDSYFHTPLGVAAQDAAHGGVSNEVVEGRGIMTTPAKALQVANETGSRVLYTPSRGFLSDMVRGGMQLVFKNSLASRDMTQFMLNNPTANYSLHSEATLTALGAAKMLGAAGQQVGGKFNLVSAFYSQATADRVFGGIGATAWVVPPHLADSAGMFTTFNPVAAVTYGTAGVVTLEHFHGYKTYYPD